MATILDLKNRKISDLTVQEYRDLFFPKENKCYSIKDVCTRYGVVPQTVYNWMNGGKLSYKRISEKKVVFSEADLNGFEVSHGVQAKSIN